MDMSLGTLWPDEGLFLVSEFPHPITASPNVNLKGGIFDHLVFNHAIV